VNGGLTDSTGRKGGGGDGRAWPALTCTDQGKCNFDVRGLERRVRELAASLPGCGCGRGERVVRVEHLDAAAHGGRWPTSGVSCWPAPCISASDLASSRPSSDGSAPSFCEQCRWSVRHGPASARAGCCGRRGQVRTLTAAAAFFLLREEDIDALARGPGLLGTEPPP